MLDSIKSIQAQQIYRVNPVSLNESRNQRNQRNLEVNLFSQGNYSLARPSVEGSPTLGRSLDLFG